MYVVGLKTVQQIFIRLLPELEDFIYGDIFKFADDIIIIRRISGEVDSTQGSWRIRFEWYQNSNLAVELAVPGSRL